MNKKILIILLMVVLFLTGCGEKKDRVVIYTSMEEVRNQELKRMVAEEFPELDVVEFPTADTPDTILFQGLWLTEKGEFILEYEGYCKTNKIKPINFDVIKIAKNYSTVYFYEESVKSGSIGESFAELLLENDFNSNYYHISINDGFVAHSSVDSLMVQFGFDKESIIKNIMEKHNGWQKETW